MKHPLMKFTWKIRNGRYTSAKLVYLGDISVGSVFYSASAPRDQTHKYVYSVTLPGAPNTNEHFATEYEAMLAAEKVLMAWIDRAELEVKGG